VRRVAGSASRAERTRLLAKARVMLNYAVGVTYVDPPVWREKISTMSAGELRAVVAEFDLGGGGRHVAGILDRLDALR
jgi:hypothetical protein